jgi:hypothetical protein
MDYLNYRGEKIRLARKYDDYDDYKDDPVNLDASAIPRVERMVTEARIGPDFANWKDFVDQLFAIKFPGYGLGPGPKVVAADFHSPGTAQLVVFGSEWKSRRGHGVGLDRPWRPPGQRGQHILSIQAEAGCCWVQSDGGRDPARAGEAVQ